jgi:hypothetical protein
MRPPLFIFALAVTLAVSGCVAVESGSGVVIQNIEPDLPEAI